jgi:hypothetical protein
MHRRVWDPANPRGGAAEFCLFFGFLVFGGPAQGAYITHMESTYAAYYAVHAPAQMFQCA